jgi:hypothetical protein
MVLLPLNRIRLRAWADFMAVAWVAAFMVAPAAEAASTAAAEWAAAAATAVAERVAVTAAGDIDKTVRVECSTLCSAL